MILIDCQKSMLNFSLINVSGFYEVYSSVWCTDFIMFALLQI